MDAWKVGIEIGLTNAVSSALGVISRELLGLDKQVKGLTASFNEWGDAAKGIVALGVGASILGFTSKMISDGAELNKQVGQLTTMLATLKELKQDTAAAVNAAVKYPGTTISQNIGFEREILPQVKDEAQMRQVLPLILPYVQNLARTLKMNPDEIVSQGLKAVDVSGGSLNPKTGQFDPARIERSFHAMSDLLLFSQGNIHMNDVLRYAQMASTFLRLFSDPKNMWEQALTPMLEMGGSKAGTAFTGISQQLIAGRTTMAAIKEGVRLGLVDPKSVHGKGLAAYVDQGGWQGDAFLQSGDIFGWMTQVFKPSVDKHTKGPVIQSDYVRELSRFFGRQNSARLGAVFLLAKEQMNRDIAGQDAMWPHDNRQTMMNTDLGANTNALSTSMTSLFSLLGSGLAKSAVTGLQSLTAVVGQLVGFFGADARAADTTGKNIAATGAALTEFGGYKLFSAFSGGFGLSDSATALTGAANALDSAAVALGGKSGLPGAKPGSNPGGGGMPPWLGFVMQAPYVWNALKSANSSIMDDFRAAPGAWEYLKRWMLPDFHRSSLSASERAANAGGGWGIMARANMASGPLPTIQQYPGNGMAPAGRGGRFNAPYSGPVPTIQQSSTATVTVNIDGKALAKYVTDMVMKTISTLIPHPTSAPFASGSAAAPAVDSGLYGHI